MRETGVEQDEATRPRWIDRLPKPLRLAIGFLLLLVGGILSLPLVPGPGIVLILLGLVVLSRDLLWASRALDWAKRKWHDLRRLGDSEGGLLVNRKRLIIGAAVLGGIFLIGFLPQYIRAQRLARQLRDAQYGQQICRARDLLGSVFLQTSLRNYGVAKEYASSFFDQARTISSLPISPGLQRALQQSLRARDDLTAQLARGDPSSYNLAQGLYQSLLQAAP